MSLAFFNRWAPVFMRRFMADFDADVLDAAAVFGNSGQESNGFRELQERKPLVAGSRGGYGIFMWTASRRRAFEAYCKRHGYDPSDMDVNYKFFFVEMNGPEGRRVLPKLKAAKTLDEKVEVFCNTFLRPGIPHMDSRKAWARRAMEAYRASPGSAVPTNTESAPANPVAPVNRDKLGKPAPKGLLGAFLAVIAAVVGVIGKKQGWW